MPATKTCQTCGRTVTWRKKWERDWEQVRYCSHRCRRHRPVTQGGRVVDPSTARGPIRIRRRQA